MKHSTNLAYRAGLPGLLVAVACTALAGCATANDLGPGQVHCEDAGPQTPRDIRQTAGSNTVSFDVAPPAAEMTLCDIHFHRFAEHQAAGYTELAGEGDNRGYICRDSQPGSVHAMNTSQAGGDGCDGIAMGDSVEVHWVFTTCDVEPGPGLGSCLAEGCDPLLRVEARVFHLTDVAGALDFADFANPESVQLPAAGDAVQYQGSTTGPTFNPEGICSAFQVTWNVSPECQALSKSSLDAWCGKENNPFQEYKAHGVRRLVKDLSLLSEIE